MFNEYFEYLEDLRDSGVVNMFGAGEYLESEFGLSKKDARNVLASWMDSFKKSEPEKDEMVEPEKDTSVKTSTSILEETKFSKGNVYAYHKKDGFFQVSHTTKKRAYFTEGHTKKFADFKHIEFYETR